MLKNTIDGAKSWKRHYSLSSYAPIKSKKASALFCAFSCDSLGSQALTTL